MRFNYVIIFILSIITFHTFPNLAHAACVNPPGVEGKQVYNGTYKTMQFCDGTLWYSMKGGGGGLPSNCNTDEILKWNGTAWVCAAGSTTTNDILTFFRLAEVSSLSVQNIVDGVVDEFEDETGVDTGTSTNETYDAAGDYYIGGAQYSTNLVPLMTSSTTPSGVASANAEQVGKEAWRAFGSYQWSANTGVAAWLQYKFATAITLTKYTIRDGSQAMATSWTLKASNTGAFTGEEVVLDTQTGLVWASDTKTFLVANSTAYLYYRLDITAHSGSGGPVIADWAMMENPGALNMALISNATTALAQPGEAFIVLWQEDVDAITENTDLKAYASRDGGTTWTQITLTEEANLSTGRILTGTADISGQPVGTSMKYRIKTLNAKRQRIHGVGMTWN